MTLVGLIESQDMQNFYGMKELSIKTALNLTKNRKSAILSETNVEPQLPSDLAHNQAKIKQQSSNFSIFHTSHKMMDCHCYLLVAHWWDTFCCWQICNYNLRLQLSNG